MPEPQYLALLRGINVGGKNIIKIAELKACFENTGLTDVVTYIQSGNVLFAAPKHDPEQLTDTLEAALSERFSYTSRVVVMSHDQLKNTVDHAPPHFGNAPTEFRYDVIFLKPPLAATEAMKSISTKENVDQAWTGNGVLYFARLIENAAQSHLSRIVQLPVYQHMTIRNWNTTTKLLALMDARATVSF